MKYVYTAVFTPGEDGSYSVAIPDLPGCITGGVDLADSLEMIRDAGAMWLWDSESCKECIPPATPIDRIAVDNNQTRSLVLLDTDAYRRTKDNRAVKKTLSIPNWLNTEAERAGVNFSQVLQDGLKTRLGIE